jgi:hypothetical protein
VTASDTELGLVVPLLALPVTFDLVAPSRPGDLAGLQLLLEGSTLGTPADITVRPATNPAGVGLNIAFVNIPNSITLGAPVSIAVDELKTTFNGLRLPTSCPSSAAKVIVSGNSYQDPTTRTASAPLDVTGCPRLPTPRRSTSPRPRARATAASRSSPTSPSGPVRPPAGLSDSNFLRPCWRRTYQRC